ncbi:MAG: sigma-70 family RNA polymerase sigma factor [Kiloniellales bacterium]|nr:sigma-70 family RNA polymerase sigma factor [Kiloniellales bacterium]
MQDSGLLQTYREYEWELLRFLGRRLRSPSLASDIAQDLYLKLLDAKEPTAVRDRRAYLFSMAANLARDHLKVEKRRSEILAEIDGLVWRRTEELTPERHAMARAELEYLEAAVAALPARCRRVFHLSRYQGRSQAEIAETLGIGLTTVYKDLKAAIGALAAARRRFRGLSVADEKRERVPAHSSDGRG